MGIDQNTSPDAQDRARQLRTYAAAAQGLPSDQNRAEVRIYASLLTGGFVYSVAEAIFYLCEVPDSVLGRVAALAPWTWCIVCGFAISLAALLPHLASLLFLPSSLDMRWPRVWAAVGAMVSATTWLYVANLSTPLPLGSVELGYYGRAVGSVVMGLAYGISLNAQLLRSLTHVTQSR